MRPWSPLFVFDGKAGVRPGDEELAQLLRSRKIPTIIAAKQDRHRERDPAGDGRLPSRPRRDPRLSAMQGLGTGDLLDKIVELLPENDPEPDADDAVRLTFLGRPNVGKSSLMNRIVGKERVIVSDVAGTTRDAIDLRLEIDGRKVILVDTAGLRRQAKVTDSVDTTWGSVAAAPPTAPTSPSSSATRRTASRARPPRRAARDGIGCATALVLNKWMSRRWTRPS